MSLVGKKLTQFNFTRTRNVKKKQIESRDELDPLLLAAQRRDSLEDVSLCVSLNATVMPSQRMTKSNSLGSISNEGCDSVLNHNDIERLTQNVRSFSDALNRLKDVFTSDEGSHSDVRKNAHERLGDLLCELKGVLKCYPTLYTIDVLTMASLLITKIKSCCYEELESDNTQMLYSIDQLALAFSSSVSEYLMGDIDNYPLLGKTKSHENLLVGDLNNSRPDSVDRRDTALSQEDIDTVLHRLDDGVDIALQRAKAWSKYAKEILTYVEKKNALEADYAKNVSKLAGSVRHMISEDKYLLFQSVYCLALDQDADSAKTHQFTCNLIQTQKFVQPLNMRRVEHEKTRKSLKDTWTKELRKMQDAVANLKKAKTMYVSRQQEYEKAKDVAQKAETESLSSSAATKAEKKKKQVDDTLHRAMEAETTYKACVVEANNKQAELERVKADILAQLRELIYTSDQTMKQVTVDYFKLLHTVTATSPVRLQALRESCQQYEPGTQYAEYVRRLPSSANYVRNTEPFVFEPYTSDTGLCDHRKASQSSGSGSDLPNTGDAGGDQDDSDSMSGSSSKSVESSPSASPCQTHRAIINCASLGELVPTDQDHVESRHGVSVSSDGGMTFRGVSLSRPAQTHVFRKLRTPSRCRECETYVYFQGAECRKCGLASHKKCLEVLHLGCGAKHQLIRRMTTFGVDFTAHVEETRTQIPYLVRRCAREVDERGLDLRGIYRVSAVKSKVERLCQSFETDCEDVDLSEHHPNVIANVLKLYLRQLPEPLLTFKLYPDFIQLSKDELSGLLPASSPQFLVALKSLTYQLPTPNFRTCGLLMQHLRRVADQEEENQMGASNLGIVFGPTLLRPSEGAASLDSLMDTPHQTRMVELLIVNVQEVFFPEVETKKVSETEAVELTEVEALTDQTDQTDPATHAEETLAATEVSAENGSASHVSDMSGPADSVTERVSDSLLDELAKEDPRFHQVTEPAVALPGSTVTLPVALPGSTETLPGNTMTLPGSTMALPGSTETLPGSTMLLPGSTETLPGSTETLPGSTADDLGAGDTYSTESLDVPGGAGVLVSSSPGLKRKLRRCDVVGPGGDSQEPAPPPVVQLTKPLLYSPALQRKIVSSSNLSSRSTCSSATDSSSDDSRLSKAVTSSQRTETDDSEMDSESAKDRDDSGVTTDVTTDDSHDTETDHSRQPQYV